MSIKNIGKMKKWIIILAVLFTTILIAYFVFKYNHRVSRIFGLLEKSRHRAMKPNIEHMRAYILSYGKYAAAIFLIIYALKPLMLVGPTALLTIVAGNVFGPMKAVVLSMMGCFLSATLAFFLARILGKPFVDKILRGKAMNLDSNIEKHGFKIMFIMRASCVFPFDPLSYASGLTKMTYKDFILATCLGVFPEMIGYSFMGKSMHKPLSIEFFLPIIIVVLIAFIAYYFYKDQRNKKQDI